MFKGRSLLIGTTIIPIIQTCGRVIIQKTKINDINKPNAVNYYGITTFNKLPDNMKQL